MVASALSIYQNIVKNQPKVQASSNSEESNNEEDEVNLNELLQGKANIHETPFTSNRPTNSPVSTTHSTVDSFHRKQ